MGRLGRLRRDFGRVVDWVESTLLVEQGVYRGVEHLDEFGKVGLVLHVEMTVAD